MILLLIAAGIIYLVCLIGMCAAWFRAPEGFEDEHGFHYGSEKDGLVAARPRRLLPFGRSGIQRRTASEHAGGLQHEAA